MSITTFADLTSLIRPDAPADKVLDFVHLLKQSEANIALPNVAKEITVSEEKPVYKSIQVKSRRGAILRTLPIITKGDEKIAKAMQVVASEGWHLYEMQFAIYCRYHGLNPATAAWPSLPTLAKKYAPELYAQFSFVRDAFMEYARQKKSSVIHRLSAI